MPKPSECPTCKKQLAKVPGAMHTKAQWAKYHPPLGSSVEPLIKKHGKRVDV